MRFHVDSSHSIQLIERFYDPLAGGIFVRASSLRGVYGLNRLFQLDEEPVAELNVQEYRKELALVSQEPTLYAGTVRFNILLGAIKPVSEVTEEEIENACRDANILDFIQSLPKYVKRCLTCTCVERFSHSGFDTEVGGKGSQLSGGQKRPSLLLFMLVSTTDDIPLERIAIARALLRNPKVLLLDEVGILDAPSRS